LSSPGFRRLRQALGVATDSENAFPNRLATVAHHIECASFQPARHREASDQTAFLVREAHDLQRMSQVHAILVQQSRDLDRAQHADVAVVVATARIVDVRAS
jgi:hypothetical protein